MKVLIPLTLFFLLGCGQEVEVESLETCLVDKVRNETIITCPEKEPVIIEDGEDGLNSLVSATRGSIDALICVSEAGIVVNSGLDSNRNEVLDSSEITSTVAVCDGLDGEDGSDAVQSQFQVVEVIDPCGDYDGPGNSDDHDEVLLKLQDGTILAWYKNLGLTILMPGFNYQTTDKQKCKFRINNDGTYQEI